MCRFIHRNNISAVRPHYLWFLAGAELQFNPMSLFRKFSPLNNMEAFNLI